MNDDRRAAIIVLLETRDDHLPEPTRRVETTPGFVNEPRPRTCPDCLANGRTMIGCETCGGSGVVASGQIARIAAVDELPDDGSTRDPYAKNDQVRVATDLTRHDEAHKRDRQIEALDRQLWRPKKEADLLEEANKHPYPWERERDRMYRHFDYAALDVALDALRNHDESAYHVLHAVYVYAWMEQTSPAAAAAIDRGLGFLDERLPDPLRSPGFTEKHPAVERAIQRRTAA